MGNAPPTPIECLSEVFGARRVVGTFHYRDTKSEDMNVTVVDIEIPISRSFAMDLISYKFLMLNVIKKSRQRADFECPIEQSRPILDMKK